MRQSKRKLSVPLWCLPTDLLEDHVSCRLLRRQPKSCISIICQKSTAQVLRNCQENISIRLRAFGCTGPARMRLHRSCIRPHWSCMHSAAQVLRSCLLENGGALLPPRRPASQPPLNNANISTSYERYLRLKLSATRSAVRARPLAGGAAGLTACRLRCWPAVSGALLLHCPRTRKRRRRLAKA